MLSDIYRISWSDVCWRGKRVRRRIRGERWWYKWIKNRLRVWLVLIGWLLITERSGLVCIARGELAGRMSRWELRWCNLVRWRWW